jgi:hypothetical protein
MVAIRTGIYSCRPGHGGKTKLLHCRREDLGLKSRPTGQDSITRHRVPGFTYNSQLLCWAIYIVLIPLDYYCILGVFGQIATR